MKLTYPACFYKNEETGYYLVQFPDLPGVFTGGYSLPEAMLMGVEAACSWLLTMMEMGNPLPEPSQSVMPDEGGFVNLLALDLEEHARKFGHQTIEETFKIPAYLSAYAKTQHLDISKIAQDALAQMHQRQYSQ